jgi:hypothetical protein
VLGDASLAICRNSIQEGVMAGNLNTDNLAHRFLGHLPFPARVRDRAEGGSGTEDDLDEYARRNDAERRAGSRELDEGGGVASEVGGTRNYHHSGGATGGDLGNRPE